MYVLLYSMYQYFSPFYKWIIFHFTDIPHCLSIHQLIRYLSCFHFLAIMNNAAVDIHIQASVWTFVFISLGYISRCGERQFFAMLFFLPIWRGEGTLSLVIYSELERTLIRRQEMWVRVLGLPLTGHLLGNSLFPQLYNEVLFFLSYNL